MGWLGLDDTDDLSGGCTTEVFHRLLQSLNAKVVESRLVRLWPFAEGRTRGNAALGAELSDYDVEEIHSQLDDFWNNEILPLKGNLSQSTHNERVQIPTDPGMVWFDEKPSDEYYRRAVKEEVEVEFISDIHWGGAGIIGATAACSWSGIEATYEAIAWRKEERKVGGCEELDILFPGTFLNRDPRRKDSLIAPRGPCPVMFGVRAHTYEEAEQAAMYLIENQDTAQITGFRVFRTNQCSDDHLDGIHSAEVISIDVKKRGHVIINTTEGNWLAFKESGKLNLLAQWLKPGDKITGMGLIYQGNRHLEKLRVITSIQRSRPLCECGKRMKSAGQKQGLRCSCGAVCDDLWVEEERKPPFQGWIQPPPDSRRHLAKPIMNS